MNSQLAAPIAHEDGTIARQFYFVARPQPQPSKFRLKPGGGCRTCGSTQFKRKLVIVARKDPREAA